jgi:hypothetical protein
VASDIVTEKDGGYFVDRILFENMIRIRRSLVPFQMTFAVFFASTLAAILTIARPATVTNLFLIAISINLVAPGVAVYQHMIT